MTSVDTGVLSSWPEALRMPIDVFLDRAERGLLSAGVVRPMRATVLKALEAEIVGRVTKGSAGANPKAEDVSATLKGMGVGEKEVGGVEGVTGREWRRYIRSVMPRRSRSAWWGAFCIALSLVPVIALFLFMTLFSPAGVHVQADFPHDGVHAHLGDPGGDVTNLFQATGPEGSIHATMTEGSPLMRFFWLFAPIGPLALAATLLGLFGVVEIFGSRGKVTGLPTALFAMFFYPLLLGIVTYWLGQV